MQISLQLTHHSWKNQETALGRIFWRGAPDSIEVLESALHKNSVEPVADAFKGIAGHWCAILEHPYGTIVAQDRIRSWPFFIAHESTNAVTLTDSIKVAREVTLGQGRNKAASTEFLHLGYITGKDTLFNGVSQVEAGAWCSFFNDPPTVVEGRLPLLRHNSPGVTLEPEADDLFTNALDASLDRVLERFQGRQLVIPLSGGLDSRLLALSLKERGYDNLINFTYGTGRTSEVEISERISRELDQPWEFINYSSDDLRDSWLSPEAGSFIRESFAGASLPHIQDWYAVAQLKKRGIIEDSAIFLPGHTIVGNMHDESVLSETRPTSSSVIHSLILTHHASLRPDNSDLISSSMFTEKVSAFLDEAFYDGSPNDRLAVLEGWNILERQTKYINNSVRTYEHFGYDWALPMLDKEMFDAWQTLGLPITQDREWYRRYVNRRYSSVTGQSNETFEAFVASRVSQTKRDKIRSFLRAVGMLQRVEREIKARAVAKHPMSLHAFATCTTPKELRQFILNGGEPMGIYTERFLADEWNPYANVFDDPV